MRVLFFGALVLAMALMPHVHAEAAGLIEINPTTSPPAVGDATGVTTPPPKTGWNAPNANPDPGKAVVHLNGMTAWDVGAAAGRGKPLPAGRAGP